MTWTLTAAIADELRRRGLPTEGAGEMADVARRVAQASGVGVWGAVHQMLRMAEALSPGSPKATEARRLMRELEPRLRRQRFAARLQKQIRKRRRG